ncbi:hypothetical protein TrLO_g7453 [Triparma laevis f. longispina]|uniref:Uncharacterized protein n=1 Tax=Triparma laevis f. longispina TaxID=1714387 RepID=A0A9W6ZKB9_9STRA|nr:hypothetical protein TrLO_g7453 [Triparma laevis f. longispina]
MEENVWTPLKTPDLMVKVDINYDDNGCKTIIGKNQAGIARAITLFDGPIEDAMNFEHGRGARWRTKEHRNVGVIGREITTINNHSDIFYNVNGFGFPGLAGREWVTISLLVLVCVLITSSFAALNVRYAVTLDGVTISNKFPFLKYPTDLLISATPKNEKKWKYKDRIYTTSPTSHLLLHSINNDITNARPTIGCDMYII